MTSVVMFERFIEMVSQIAVVASQTTLPAPLEPLTVKAIPF